MLSCTYINAKLLAKEDIPDLLIEGEKYRPIYEPPYDLISEKDFLDLFEHSASYGVKSIIAITATTRIIIKVLKLESVIFMLL